MRGIHPRSVLLTSCLLSLACSSSSPASQPLDFSVGDAGADGAGTLRSPDASSSKPKPAPLDASWPSGVSHLPWDAGLSGGTSRVASGLVTNLPAHLYDWNGALAADTDLFWGVTGATVGAGSVVRAHLDGSDRAVIASATSPSAFATDGANVYWLDLITDASFETHVMQAPRGGGAAITLATTPYAGHCLSVAGGNVFWSAAGAFQSSGPSNGGWTPGDGIVASTPIGGGVTVTLASLPETFATPCVTADDTYAYWTSSSFTVNAVLRSSIEGGGTTTTLASSTSWVPERLAVTKDALYVATQSGQILSLPKAGGTPTTLAATTRDSAGFAVAPYGVFFGSVLSDYVGALPADGGTPEQVAWWGTSELAVQAVAANESTLYWLAFEANTHGTVILGLDLPAPPPTTK